MTTMADVLEESLTYEYTYEEEDEEVFEEDFDTYRDTFENDFAVASVPTKSGCASVSKRCNFGSYKPQGQASTQISQRVANQFKIGEKKAAGENRIQGRDDRATTEQVLDPRTRMILFKLLSNGTVSEINGCISTGKEANV